MKSLENRKKGLSVLTIAIFITAALVLAIPAIMSTNTYAQECQSPAKVLKDTNATFGWDPDGNLDRFMIIEPCYSDAKSIVLVNIKDADLEEPYNVEVCNVDWSADTRFEVYCNNAPSEGSELRYVVLDHELQVIEAPQAETQMPTDSQRKENPAQAPTQ